MKTQRMDAQHKRIEDEIQRRDLQRAFFYGKKRDTHKKLYSRALAKNILSGIEESTMQILGDLSRRLFIRLL
jgi:Radial spoke protein 3